MKNLLKMFGIIAFVGVIGFSMTACGGGDSGNIIIPPDNGGIIIPPDDGNNSNPFIGSWTGSATNLAGTVETVTITFTENTWTMIYSIGAQGRPTSGTYTWSSNTATLTTDTGQKQTITITGNTIRMGEVTLTKSSGGEPSDGGGNEVTFTSIADMKAWLDAKPTNTAATAYKIALNVNNLGGSADTSGSAGNALISNKNKYVYLDLSGSTMTYLPSDAFYEKAITGFTTLIGITIGNSVTGMSFFACTSLTAINVASGNTSYSSDQGVLYNKEKSILIKCPEGKIGAYTIPNGVTRIGGVGTTIMGDSMTNGYDGFWYCTKLTSVTIPDSVTTIGSGAFQDCTKLTSINIPNSVTNIESSAFRGCTSLTSITIPNSITKIEGGVFQTTGLTSITIPSNITSIGSSAFGECRSLTSVTFQGTISSSNFNSEAFGGTYTTIGDLRDKYLAGGIGRYTRPSGGTTWTKQ